MDLQVAVPGRSDVEDVVAVARQAGSFTEEEVAAVGEMIDASLDRGAERSGYYFILAHAPDELAGFACYGPRPLTQGTFDLYWIVVAPTHARRGIGGYLLENVVERVRALSGRLLIVETSGRPEYVAARRFYVSHAFGQVATIADFYSPGDDLVLYVRRLR